MKKIRKNPNQNDLLVFCDDDYLVFRKNGKGIRIITTPLDLILIGIAGLTMPDFVMSFKNEDYISIIDNLIEKLKHTKK